MRKIICLLLFLTSSMIAQAQSENPDSLINIFEKQKLTPGEQLSIYKKLGNIYLENDIKKSNLYAEKGLQLAEKEKNKGMMSVFNDQIGVNYYTMSSYDTATVHLEKALALAIEIKDSKQEALVNMNLGNLFRRQRMYEPAMERYIRSGAINDSIGNKGNYARALINIADVHGRLYHLDLETHYLKQAEEISKETDDVNLQMVISYKIGETCNIEERYDEALEYATKSIEKSRILKNKKYEIANLNLFALVYAGLKNYDMSKKYADECIQTAETYGDKRLLKGILEKLSKIYFNQNRFEECAELANRAWTIDSVDYTYGLDITSRLTYCYLYLKKTDKAAYFLEKFGGLIHEYIKESVNGALVDANVKYDTEKKETRIATLEREKQLYIWLGVAGIVVLLLIIGLLLVNRRLNIQKRKLAEQQKELAERDREMAEQQVKQLEQEKQLVAAQSVLDGETAERSRLARDLHDGLGGLLSVVKLNLKNTKGYAIMDDTDVDHFVKATEVLDQSIGELRRVAHHLMPESLMRYGLKVSLEDFCRAVPGADFQYLGDGLRLDSRMEVLIYRCTYELVNNAVKHAQATAINVQLLVDGLVSLTVQDNGIGFDPVKIAAGSGLENIRTRVSAYTGKMIIQTAPGKGTEISIEIEKV